MKLNKNHGSNIRIQTIQNYQMYQTPLINTITKRLVTQILTITKKN